VNGKEEFRVVGVMKNVPTIQPPVRYLAPLELANKWFRPGHTGTWSNHAFRSCVEMAGGTDINAFHEKIFNRMARSTTIPNPFCIPTARSIWNPGAAWPPSGHSPDRLCHSGHRLR
jgi:hypothetical protein